MWTEVPIRITRLVPNVFARLSGFYLCGTTRLKEETARLSHAVSVERHACEHSVAHLKKSAKVECVLLRFVSRAVRFELNGLGAPEW